MKYKIESKQKFKNYYGSLLGIISRISATMMLYPFMLIRTRQQQFGPKSSSILNEEVKQNVSIPKVKYGLFFHCFSHVYKTEGYLGLYKGLSVQLIRQVPYSAIFLYI